MNLLVLPAGMYATDVNLDGQSWNRGYGWTDGFSGADDDFIFNDNFSIDLNGVEERLYFPPIDLAGAISPKFYFYRSYQQRDQFNMDTLNIYVQPCGGNEVMLFSKGGSQLANIAGYNSQGYWVPYFPNQWLRDSVDLSSFAGQTVEIILGNKGDGGQLLYIDEFLVESTSTGLSESPLSNFSVFPNPTTSTIFIHTYHKSAGTISIVDLTGRECLQAVLVQGDAAIDISSLTKGVYFVKLDGVVKRVVKM